MIPKEIYEALCQMGMGNICAGQSVEGIGYVLPEVVVTPVETRPGETFFDVQIHNIAVCDNTYVNRDNQAVAQNTFNMNRVRIEHEKEVKKKVMDIVNKYYDAKIKQASSAEQKSLSEGGKFIFNNKLKMGLKLSTSDFSQELLEGENGRLIKEFISITGGDQQAYFSVREPSLLERWGESKNVFAKMTYAVSNDAYILLQVFSCGLMDKIWDRGERINELTGGMARVNLDGTTNYSPADSFVNMVPMIVSQGASSSLKLLPKGAGYVNKYNAAGFSKLLKNVPQPVRKELYAPKVRSFLNKGTNYVINKWNNQIANGFIIFKVKLLRPKNQEVEKDTHPANE